MWERGMLTCSAVYVLSGSRLLRVQVNVQPWWTRQTDSRRSVRRSITDDADNGGEGRADEVRGVTYLNPERSFER